MAGTASGQIVSNGSFETNNWDKGEEVKTELGDGTQFDIDNITAAPWNLNKNGIIQVKTPDVGTSDGRFAAALQSGRGNINQVLTFTTAGMYTLMYDSFTAPEKSSVDFKVTIDGSTTPGQLGVGQTEVGFDAAWTSRTHTFTI